MKRYAKNLLKKIKIIKRKLKKTRKKTPILSLDLKQLIPVFINKIQKKEELLQLKLQKKLLKKEEKIKKLTLNKSYMEYNFTSKYVNPIELYKDKKSLLYKNLPYKDKKIINNLKIRYNIDNLN